MRWIYSFTFCVFFLLVASPSAFSCRKNVQKNDQVLKEQIKSEPPEIEINQSSNDELINSKDALQIHNLNEAMDAFLRQWQQVHGEMDEQTQARWQNLLTQRQFHEFNDVINRHGVYQVNESVLNEALLSDSKKLINKPEVIRKRRSFTNPFINSEPNKGNCSSCKDRDFARLRRLQEIKSDILSRLSISSPPPAFSLNRSLPAVPIVHKFFASNGAANFLQSVTKQSMDYDEHLMVKDQQSFDPMDTEDDFYLTAQSSITFAQPAPSDVAIPSEYNAQYFQFTMNLIHSSLRKAELYVHVQPTQEQREATEQQVKIKLYQVIKASDSRESPMLMEVLEKVVHVDLMKDDWVTLDITKALTNWLKKPQDNLGLVIQATDFAKRSFHISKPSDDQMDSRTFIVSYHDKANSIRRPRRNAPSICDANSKEERCCRFPLTVNFEELGWDWVIAPRSYEANYCAGDCPMAYLKDYPYTKIVQGAKVNSKVCCVPRKFTPISIIYFTKEYNLIYGHLPGMIVDSCGCV